MKVRFKDLNIGDKFIFAYWPFMKSSDTEADEIPEEGQRIIVKGMRMNINEFVVTLEEPQQ